MNFEQRVRGLGGTIHEFIPPKKANGQDTRFDDDAEACGSEKEGNGAANNDDSADQAQRPLLPLPLLWFEDIDCVLEARDFVQGVLIEQGAVVVYGDSNAGKTFWITDLSLSVAAGTPWNGRRVDQGGVIYCVLEGGIGFRNRIVAWRREHKPEGKVPFAAIPAQINLLDPDADVPKLITVIKAAAEQISVPVKMVIIDTLSRAMSGGNENSSDDMGALVRNMDAIRAETGTCVVFVHHCGKDQAKGARGHSLLRAAIDTEIEVQGDDATGLRSATAVKQRDLKKGDRFDFTLKQVKLGVNQYDEDVTTCVVDKMTPEMAGSSTAAAEKSAARKKLTGVDRDLLQHIEDLLADKARAPRVGPVVRFETSIQRQTLRDRLVRRGWFDEGKIDLKTKAPTRGGLSYENNHLNALKTKGFIQFDREWVWLV